MEGLDPELLSELAERLAARASGMEEESDEHFDAMKAADVAETGEDVVHAHESSLVAATLKKKQGSTGSAPDQKGHKDLEAVDDIAEISSERREELLAEAVFETALGPMDGDAPADTLPLLFDGRLEVWSAGVAVGLCYLKAAGQARGCHRPNAWLSHPVKCMVLLSQAFSAPKFV